MLRNGLANPRANLQDYTPFKDSDPYFQLLPPPPFSECAGPVEPGRGTGHSGWKGHFLIFFNHGCFGHK